MLTLPMHMLAGAGDDTVGAGNWHDTRYGEPGKDKIWGYAGGDSMNLNDSQPGDVGHGGPGDDHCVYDGGWYSWQKMLRHDLQVLWRE